MTTKERGAWGETPDHASMRKKSSQWAFSNPRVLAGLLFVLTGAFLALLATANPGFGTGKTQRQNNIIISSTDPLVPAGFDCSGIDRLGIDKQMNFRAGAIMTACGATQAGGGLLLDSPFQATIPQPAMFGRSDVDLITGTETSPNVTQSTTFAAGNPDNLSQIVIGYNDSRGMNAIPINISGASVSTDGGNTFTRLTRTNGQSPFDNTFGDPVVLFHKPTSTWFTVWLDGACGGQGLGGYKSTTPSDPNSWTHFCVHNGSADDRESGWADNNSSTPSPFYGRIYVSWNDFNQPNANIFSKFSTDGGATWSSPVTVSTQAQFIRNVQITGDVVTGDVYIAGMDEGGGGFPHNDRNLIFKSTDGGNTWTNTYTGPAFPGPGVSTCSDNAYFACMFSDGGGYWRHEGWGQPAVFNHVVSLVYAQHGSTTDPGDIYYIRSTDSGATFSAPIKLNTDTTSRPQWEPNLSVGATGNLFATWYDARESASCTQGNPSVPCYRIWSRKSTDNGVTWLADDTFSDVVSPLPAQPDPGIQPSYVSSYDYAFSTGNLHLSGWVDGRVAISGASQQDAFADRDCEQINPRIPCGGPAPTSTPTPTPTPTPTSTPTPTPTPTPQNVPPSPTPTPTSTPTPTPIRRVP